MKKGVKAEEKAAKSVIEMNDAEIKALQERKKEERVQQCMVEINAVLEKHNCIL